MGLLVMVLGFTTTADETSGNISVSSAPWTGIWQSVLYKETFQQTGDTVTGEYVPLSSQMTDAGSIAGNLTDNGTTLSGTWKETGDIRLDISDNSSLKALWAYQTEPENFTKVYEGESNDGIWNSENHTMSLFLNGRTVQGSYDSIDRLSSECGIFVGTVTEDGKEISGTFVEYGDIDIKLSKDRSQFNGTYTYGNKPVLPDDTWNATRIE